MMFDVIVRFVDKEFNKFSHTHRIYGKDIACQYSIDFSLCDNVVSVDMCNSSTGEVIMTVTHGDITYRVEN